MKKLLVITGPSAAGIGELITALFQRRQDLGTVVPVTARKMRAGEENGVGFFFYDLDGWKALQESGGLLETTEFAGNDYGTSRALVEEKLEEGKHVLLNLEVERAAQVKRNMPQAVCVYVEPSPAVLRQRVEAVSRSGFEVSVRLETAERQRALSDFCDARVCSDDPETALREIEGILDRE